MVFFPLARNRGKRPREKRSPYAMTQHLQSFIFPNKISTPSVEISFVTQQKTCLKR